MATLIAAGPLRVQSQTRVVRVGVLSPAQPQDSPLWQAYFRGMRERGWDEGKNVQYVFRYAQGDFAQLPAFARELVAANVDVIVALNSPGARAAIDATQRVPIVMIAVGDPVGTGFIKNFARPGGNVTGVTNNTGEVSAKRLEILVEALPAAKRIAVMGNPADPVYAPQRSMVETAARKLGVTLVMVDVRKLGGLGDAFKRVAELRADAVLRLADPFVTLERTEFAREALLRKLPSISILANEAEAGAMLSYGADSAEQYQRGAVYTDRILRGTKPGDLPVEQPTRFQFVVNLRTAKKLGVNLPQSILVRAERVIE